MKKAMKLSNNFPNHDGKNPVIVIVDAYAAGTDLAAIFAANGIKCVHVQSKPFDSSLIDISKFKILAKKLLAKFFISKFKQEDLEEAVELLYSNNRIGAVLRLKNIFISNYVYQGDLAKLANELTTKFHVKYVIAGHESGVLVADSLSNYLNLTSTNDIKFSQARRNKFLMHKALQEKNINSVKQHVSSDLNEILNWVKENTTYPVVLKPIAGMAGMDVCVCGDDQQVKQAFNLILSKKTLFLEMNQQVLVQSFIDGREYTVNTVSYDNHHIVCEIIDTEKPVLDGNPAVDFFQDYVLPDDSRYKLLAEYALQVLDALRICYGPAHLEIKINSLGQPVLIEIGARLMGGAYNPSLLTELIGTNQISLTAEAFMNPVEFCKKPTLPMIVNPLYARKVCLVSPLSGELKRDITTDFLKNLKTFYSCELFIGKKGDTLLQAKNGLTMPGIVYLLSNQFESILEDTKTIRAWEENCYRQALNPEQSSPKKRSNFFCCFPFTPAPKILIENETSPLLQSKQSM